MCPTAPFRSSYQYNNFMPALAGHVLEVALGSTWEQLTQQYILDRLGMNKTGFLSIQPQPLDLASPYSSLNTTIYQVDTEFIQWVYLFYHEYIISDGMTIIGFYYISSRIKIIGHCGISGGVMIIGYCDFYLMCLARFPTMAFVVQIGIQIFFIYPWVGHASTAIFA